MASRSVKCLVSLAQGLGIDELPLDNRSDEWWAEFWREMGMAEVMRMAVTL